MTDLIVFAPFLKCEGLQWIIISALCIVLRREFCLCRSLQRIGTLAQNEQNWPVTSDHILVQFLLVRVSQHSSLLQYVHLYFKANRSSIMNLYKFRRYVGQVGHYWPQFNLKNSVQLQNQWKWVPNWQRRHAELLCRSGCPCNVVVVNK